MGSLLKKRILLIDDHSPNLENLTEILEMEGYQVFFSHNGEEGILLTKAQLPNLVISDIKLPGIDGFELIKQLKANPSTQQIPILLLSAFSEKSMINKGLELGAKGYLVKPFGMEEMLITVQKIITDIN
ncbi:MAG: response regulator [Bacteroidota bacterium]